MREHRQIVPIERRATGEIRDVDEGPHGARQFDPFGGVHSACC